MRLERFMTSDFIRRRTADVGAHWVLDRKRGSAGRRWRATPNANRSKLSSPARGIIWVLPIAITLWAFIFLAGAELFALFARLR